MSLQTFTEMPNVAVQYLATTNSTTSEHRPNLWGQRSCENCLVLNIGSCTNFVNYSINGLAIPSNNVCRDLGFIVTSVLQKGYMAWRICLTAIV